MKAPNIKAQIREQLEGTLPEQLDRSMDAVSDAFLERMVNDGFPVTELAKHLLRALLVEAHRDEHVHSRSEAHNLLAYWASSPLWFPGVIS